VTVTHPDVNRYFVSLSKAVELLVAAASATGPGGIYMSDLGEPVRILDLAHQVIENAGFEPESEIPIVMTGLRPGDKMSEQFLSDSESIAAPSGEGETLRLIHTPEPAHEKFDALIAELQDAADRRDVADVLDRLCRLVPEYQPSETVLALRKNAAPHSV
jgi:FlaA1/EpsC-like NDP-sugar epimerase